MSTLSKCTSWLVCLPSVCLIAVSVCLSFVCRLSLCLTDAWRFYMLICLPFIFCMSVILSFVCLTTSWHLSVRQHQSVCLSACHLFVCLLSVCHLLSIYQHVPVFMTLWVWLSITCDILFSSFDVSPLFTLNQALVFRSSLIVQPSLLALCTSVCLLVTLTTP